MSIKIPKIEIGKNINEIEVNFEVVHAENFVDIDEILKPQPVALSIGQSEYKGRFYPIAVGSFGDFSCIVAPSKSRKSFLKSLLVSCAKGGTSNQYSGGITGHNFEGKYIIDIDTEQSKYHSQRAFRRVAELAGHNSDFYRPFALRSLSPDERFNFIDWLFTKSQYVGKIGLVSIDGVADLINDINDLEAANRVTQKLLEWSANSQCHIITVLHCSYGVKKPTGHLGSAITKKAESVLFLEPEEEFTKVDPFYTRNEPFKPFSFGINPDSLPYVLGDEIPAGVLNELERRQSKETPAEF